MELVRPMAHRAKASRARAASLLLVALAGTCTIVVYRKGEDQPDVLREVAGSSSTDEVIGVMGECEERLVCFCSFVKLAILC